MVGEIVRQPLVPRAVDFSDRAHLRIVALDIVDQSDDPEVYRGKVRIGAKLVADYHGTFGLELGERPLDLLGAKIRPLQ